MPEEPQDKADESYETRIRTWLKDERIKHEDKTTPADEFRLLIDYPPAHPRPLKIELVQPRGRKLIRLGMAVLVNPQHFELMRQKDRPAITKFVSDAMNAMLSQPINFGWRMQDGTPNGWIIQDSIYFDGLTQDRLFKTIQTIVRCARWMFGLHGRVLGITPSPDKPETKKDESFFVDPYG
ncbi:MAG: DUF2299 family protein [Candidatus Heimdallarchaeota archaeon]